ncbi:LysR substrate-binding domain-containing protein [Arvimicrobium flavum]|uniref:LysR substrate-binding domain-containing protein n=1 Tax=Arvimicrobium flavum TaxID=3393320 RepID=UPI00237BBE0E|nr:LysR substrate-binding domain-containing protein [Mesorhizobium shangrilense]
MKRGRLPLTALRSFEAAGRLSSFSRAAEELFVSQAAISRQIRALETLIDQQLFERLHRRVELTDAGRRLLDQLIRSFDDIDQRLSEIMSAPAQHLLKVSVEPFFAAGWLLPHLVQFRAKRPDIDVLVDVNGRLVEFRSREAELAIRFSAANTSWPRVQAQHLIDGTHTPLLSRALLASGPELRRPADLLNYTLLHDDNRNAWPLWFKAAGVTNPPTGRGPLFPDGALGVQAAILGHGVVLGDLVVNSQDLRSKRLVKPFTVAVRYGAYWLVAPDFANLSEPARAFADWLCQEIKTEDGA